MGNSKRINKNKNIDNYLIIVYVFEGDKSIEKCYKR